MFNFCWILSSMYYLWKQQHQQQQKQATCVMDAWEVLHLVLKIFPSFSGQTGSKVLLLLFMCKEMPKYFYPPDFAVWNAINFSTNPDSGPPHAPMLYYSCCQTSLTFFLKCQAVSNKTKLHTLLQPQVQDQRLCWNLIVCKTSYGTW